MNCILFNAPPEKFTPIWRCYYWRWRAAIFRLKLGNKAGRDLYRSLQETLIEYWETVFQITANLKWVGIYRCKAILVTRKTHWHYRAAFKLCHVETIREGLQKYKTRIYKFFFFFFYLFENNMHASREAKLTFVLGWTADKDRWYSTIQGRQQFI